MSSQSPGRALLIGPADGLRRRAPAILELHSALLVRPGGDWVEVFGATVRGPDRLDARGAG